jgi:predicted transcriptional regulator
MSIHPQFAERLLAGSKRVEFRRRAASRPLTHILIYATLPVGGVVGVAEVERLERGSPVHLWAVFASVAGIDRASFFSYFDGVEEGFAYVVRRVWACSAPIPLGRDGLPKLPPQAFQYVGARTLDAVLSKIAADPAPGARDARLLRTNVQ